MKNNSERSIEANFAENLHRKCREFGSISAFCRQVEINRQQFSRYLSGKGIPSAVNMRKICKALNTTEAELLQLETDKNLSPPQYLSPMSFQFLDPLNTRNQFDRNVSELSEGFYFCYLPYTRIPGMLMKSVVCFTRRGQVLEFSRLTLFPSATGAMSPLFKGKHKGVVCANESEIYLIGSNRFPPHQLSFMTVSKLDGTNKGIHSGKILTRSNNSLISSECCLVRINSSQSRKSIVNELGIVASNERGAEALIGSGLLP